MSAESNEDIVRRFFEEIWNEGRLEVAEDLVALNFVLHDNPYQDHSPGPVGVRRNRAEQAETFPRQRYDVHDLFGDGDKVAARATFHFEHTKEVFGTRPRGARCRCAE